MHKLFGGKGLDLFVNRAALDVIEKTKAQALELQDQIAKLKAMIEAL